MKKQCKSCPYFLSSLSNEQYLEKLKELAFWLKFAALHKDAVEVSNNAEINKELRKIEAILKVIYRGKMRSEKAP